MQKDIALFNELINQLLKDEQNHPVATHIPSSTLFEN